jgi:hypothetical protein
MGRTKNVDVWRHFTTNDEGTECNFCKKMYKSKNVNKLESHLLSCLHCPDVVKLRINRKQSQILPQTSTQVSTQLSNITENLNDNESSTSSIAMSSPQSSRASTPQSSRASTPTLMSLKPLSMFFDRMSDQDNVRKKHTTLNQFV